MIWYRSIGLWVDILRKLGPNRQGTKMKRIATFFLAHELYRDFRRVSKKQGRALLGARPTRDVTSFRRRAASIPLRLLLLAGVGPALDRP
jgi:hypothetical protein